MAETRGDLRQRLISAAIQGVRLYGVGALRVQQVGALAGTAASSIYTYFGGKEAMLDACFEHVERQIAHVFGRVKLTPDEVAQDPMGALRRLWAPYWRWLTRHPDEAVFYHRFRDSSEFAGYDQMRRATWFGSFFASMELFEEQYHLQARTGGDLLWLHLLSTTALYAKYVIEGVLPDTAETEEAVFHLEMHGLEGLLTGGGDPAE